MQFTELWGTAQRYYIWKITNSALKVLDFSRCLGEKNQED